MIATEAFYFNSNARRWRSKRNILKMSFVRVIWRICRFLRNIEIIGEGLRRWALGTEIIHRLHVLARKRVRVNISWTIWTCWKFKWMLGNGRLELYSVGSQNKINQKLKPRPPKINSTLVKILGPPHLWLQPLKQYFRHNCIGSLFDLLLSITLIQRDGFTA